MIIYNVTTKVSWDVHDNWKKWLSEQKIPAMLETGLFNSYQLVRLLEVDDHDGPTYALQLYSYTMSHVDIFREKFLDNFNEEEQERWRNATISFSSLMEVIN